ncbi:MAG: T9SS type A sorting domain-containing protein, partial [Melioribacteraceae bacterium]|nr:T9SS type A sorting domain-containing protein [Melioribacteraceae bacterium]
QIRLNRQTDNVYGSILFRAQNLFGNANGVTDSLNNNFFINKALLPQMSWKDSISPLTPNNLRFEALTNARGEGLIWDTPLSAADGDSASMYVVYQLDNNIASEDDIADPANIWKIQKNQSAMLNKSDKVADQMFFAVSSLDDNYNESPISSIVEVQLSIPDVPILVGPADNSENQRDTTTLIWDNSLHSSYNTLQIAKDSEFSELVFQKSEIVDTFYNVTVLDGLSNYYWRVSASNIAGSSEYSNYSSFSTGFPTSPLLASPLDKELDVSLNPNLTWNMLAEATQYNIQVAEGLSIEPSIIIIDTLVQDTILTISNLSPEKIYSWHVRANNEFGFGKWSEVSKFKTSQVTSVYDNLMPLTFKLEQNYPNPFNPETTIKFSIPKDGFVSLKIYDILGREVSVLLKENLLKGSYEYNFNAVNYSSGMYIYVLSSGQNVTSKKMLLIK